MARRFYIRELTKADYESSEGKAGKWKEKGYKYALATSGIIWEVFKSRQKAKNKKYALELR